jgi:hypothetical protein
LAVDDDPGRPTSDQGRPATGARASWLAGIRVHLLVEAGDVAGDSLVEAAVDDLSVMRTGQAAVGIPPM